MQRLRKPFIWLVLVSLIITLTPASLTSPVSAASPDLSSTTYFSPDILDIRKTASYVMETQTGKTRISRDNVYKVSQPNLTIQGTFAQVSPSNMTVSVEQLRIKDNGDFEVDPNNYNTVGITTDPNDSSGRRFIARDLTLFSGFNRITFTGLQGTMQRSESFYVLFDKIPYLSDLRLVGGGTNGVALNEGTPVVVKSGAISLQGIAMNATRVSVSANGGTALQSSIDPYTGNFYTPGLTLKTGLNTLNLIIQNGSDSFNVQRTVYYYQQDDPITALYVFDGTASHNLKENEPTLTSGPITIVGQMLLPYSSNDFQSGNTTISLNDVNVNGYSLVQVNPFIQSTGGTWQINEFPANTPAAEREIIIPDANGQPEFRLVTFKLDDAFQPTGNGNQNVVKLTIQHSLAGTTGTVNHTVSRQFRYMPGQSLISNLYYLPSYEPGNNENVSEEPLNGAQVNSSTFYIAVEFSAAPASFTGQLLPLGTRSINPEYVGVVGGDATKVIYKISNFPSGQQQIRFSNGSDSRDITISYVAMNNITIDNLTDGQTYSFDSKITNQFPITGRFIGFEKIESAEYYVNGISGAELRGAANSNSNDNGTRLDFNVLSSPHTFNLNLNVKRSGPLVYGENIIRFVGAYKDTLGNTVERVKELRIYIIDKNSSNIDAFIPSEANDNRPTLPSLPLYQKISYPSASDPVGDVEKTLFDTTMANLLALSPRFEYNSTQNSYTTTQEKYDLIVRGGGADEVNVYRGSEKMFTVTLPANQVGSTPNNTGTIDGTPYTYQWIGSQKDFVLRVQDLAFKSPGTHVYNLELVNSTGARTTQRLEVVRVVEPYRLLSPQPTVGDQYVVNKNFIRFDIEAEGATKVLIGKDEASPIQENGKTDRFIYDFVGLKPDKSTNIKIQIVREDTTLNDSINVYYTSTADVTSQFMAEKVAAKYSAFNKKVELSFPKGTILETANPGSNVTQYYPNNKLLFGIADPSDGVVERRDDYGNYIGRRQSNVESPLPELAITANLSARFNSVTATSNFTLVSDIYWINGGLGEYKEGNTYYPSTNGLAPHSQQGYFPDYNELPGNSAVVPTGARKLVPSERGTLTLKFDQNVVDAAGTTITVFRYNRSASSGVWENIGGEVNMKANTITVPFDDFGYYKVMKLRKGYTDITNHGWARNILNGLYSKGIMPAMRVDAFGTDDMTSRGEFATLLVKGLNLPLNYKDGEQTFFDIVTGASTATWSFEHIETAARAGIITGQTEGYFNAGFSVTREQAAVMIARALKLNLPANDDKLAASLAKSFTDSGSIGYYARPAVMAVSKAGIMTGSATTLPGQSKPVYSFNPGGNLTRAEAGKIVVELLKKSTDIFPKNFN